MEFIVLIAAAGGIALLLWMLLDQSEKKLRERNQSEYKSGRDAGKQVEINQESIQHACSAAVTLFHNAINSYSTLVAYGLEFESKKEFENAESYLLGSISILILQTYEPKSGVAQRDIWVVKVITEEEWIMICEKLALKVIGDKPSLYGQNSSPAQVGFRLANRLRLQSFDENFYNLGKRHAKALLQFFYKRGPEPDYSEFREEMRRMS